jgi:hypothetical protein
LLMIGLNTDRRPCVFFASIAKALLATDIKSSFLPSAFEGYRGRSCEERLDWEPDRIEPAMRLVRIHWVFRRTLRG